MLIRLEVTKGISLAHQALGDPGKCGSGNHGGDGRNASFVPPIPVLMMVAPAASIFWASATISIGTAIVHQVQHAQPIDDDERPTAARAARTTSTAKRIRLS